MPREWPCKSNVWAHASVGVILIQLACLDGLALKATIQTKTFQPMRAQGWMQNKLPKVWHCKGSVCKGKVILKSTALGKKQTNKHIPMLSNANQKLWAECLVAMWLSVWKFCVCFKTPTLSLQSVLLWICRSRQKREAGGMPGAKI